MPIGLASHDITILGDSVYFITGGVQRSSESYYSANTFIFYEDEQEWTHGPTFNYARSSHISGFVTGSTTEEIILVIAGGFNGTSMDSVELLYFGQENNWILGKLSLCDRYIFLS